ncbi:MAG: ATP-grasp domain-containing protein [Caldilineaceae bacterium]
MQSTSNRPHRIMLLITARSYRGEAFMQAAQGLGIEVIQVIDMARELAEFWHYPLGVDFNQPEAAVQAIVDFAAKTPVDAILGIDDSGTLLAARASARLGLPHNSPLAAKAARDKFRMRTLMSAAGVPCPIFRRFTTADDPHAVATQVSYPCVVKPLNLNGSRGVIRANNPQEFGAAVQRLAQMLEQEQPDDEPKPYLVEDFIPGFEVALEGMLDQGQLTVLALFDKPDPLDGPFFEETIYVTPSRLPAETQSAIADCVARAAHSLGLQGGPVHAELRVNERGPWMLEVAGRSIGGLCSQTLRFDMDTSLETLILRQACGLPLLTTQREQTASGVMMIPIPGAGILQRVDGISEAEAVPLIESIEITAKLHYPITPLPEGESYLGFIFARGVTPAEVEVALREAHSKLHFEIVPEIELSA